MPGGSASTDSACVSAEAARVLADRAGGSKVRDGRRIERPERPDSTWRVAGLFRHPEVLRGVRWGDFRPDVSDDLDVTNATAGPPFVGSASEAQQCLRDSAARNDLLDSVDPSADTSCTLRFRPLSPRTRDASTDASETYAAARTACGATQGGILG